MSDNELKERAVGGIVSSIVCFSCHVLWMLDFGGMAYLFGLLMTLGPVPFVLSMVAFVVSFAMKKQYKARGLVIGLVIGISGCVYMQSISN